MNADNIRHCLWQFRTGGLSKETFLSFMDEELSAGEQDPAKAVVCIPVQQRDQILELLALASPGSAAAQLLGAVPVSSRACGNAGPWIKVSDRLPAKGHTVDLWRAGAPARRLLADYHLVIRSKTNWFFDPVFAGLSCVRDATHWREPEAGPRDPL